MAPLSATDLLRVCSVYKDTMQLDLNSSLLPPPGLFLFSIQEVMVCGVCCFSSLKPIKASSQGMWRLKFRSGRQRH